MRRLARRVRLAVARARFRVWAARLALALRRNGGRLALDAPHGAAFYEAPLIEATPDGGSGGTFTLRLGRDVRLGRRLVLELWAGADSRLEIGDRTRLWSDVRVQLRRGAVCVGSDVQVRDRVQLKADGLLTVGDHGVLGRDSLLHCSERIDVGSHVGMGERTSVIDSDHSPDGSERYYLDQPLRVTPVRVARNVLISANVVLLRGSRLGANSMVGAGSVVAAGDYPAGWLVAGIPARPRHALGDRPTSADPEPAAS